jgi:hypothetical protein
MTTEAVKLDLTPQGNSRQESKATKAGRYCACTSVWPGCKTPAPSV